MIITASAGGISQITSNGAIKVYASIANGMASAFPRELYIIFILQTSIPNTLGAIGI